MIGNRVGEEFRRRFGREPSLARAPGRVNLIGEHTDYNDGFVLPVAIDRFCFVAFAANDRGELRGYSLERGEEASESVDALSPRKTARWFDYAAGVLWAHRRSGIDAGGVDFVVGGDVPIGAGLSSSAAFELAVARALVELAGADWDGVTEARLAQKAENEYVGVPCGIMDQMAASLSKAESAMLLDCRHLTFERVPVPKELAVVVLDTATRRTLAGSGYDDRRRSCEEAAAALSLPALRDASRAMLASARARLSDTAYRRALHVVEENERALELAAALPTFDRDRIARLLRESHQSLRDRFEVSSPALDRMVELASSHEAAVGARMTGAGFGGCAVALVEASRAGEFVAEVESSYRRSTGHPGKLHVCRTVDGASIVSR